MPKAPCTRIEILTRLPYQDPQGEALKQLIAKEGGPLLTNLRTATVYKIDSGMLPVQSSEQLRQLGQDLFADAVLSQCCLNGELLSVMDFQWYLEVGFLPGVTDNLGRTAQESLSWYYSNSAHKPKQKKPKTQQVFSANAYFISGKLNKQQAQQLTQQWLANPLVHSYALFSQKEARALGETPELATATASSVLFSLPQVSLQEKPLIKRWSLSRAKILQELSESRLLALNSEEIQTIIKYFKCQSIKQERAKIGLDQHITDVELEILAQTWSEHCKHKIFNAQINYHTDNKPPLKIDSLFKTYIQAATQIIREELAEKDYCLSVFTDNAGVMRLNDQWGLAVKVETHNSPSALDPYGGALTGILGVNRDAFGTGRGGKLLFNTDVFCFAPPDNNLPRLAGMLAPTRIIEGVRRGVEHGGNTTGVPTVNGSLCFDARFMAKPLVFCGSGALIPNQLGEHPGHKKWVEDGDLIVMCGGRIGKDGIHGATFSSLELKSDIPLSVVQIGDPITQKKMFDFLLCARDQNLYHAITDNGAGGLSSSVGEMACLVGGATLHLELAPLKYEGLQPWEILVSESQERMTLAVAPKNREKLMQLAKEMQVECTVLGEFNTTGKFTVYWQEEIAASLELDFLHNGVPQMQLVAQWQTPFYHSELDKLPNANLTNWLLKVLARLNVCSKESIVRQYDHEVQGCSVVKPLCGPNQDGPSDAAVLSLSPAIPSIGHASSNGIAISHGICPRYSDWDTYHMAACAFDEALRSLVAVGADPNHAVALDNFCWCDPLPADNNPLATYKTAQLVRAARALYDTAIAYKVPFISGKDSMKNDFVQAQKRFSIVPTVLVTTVAFVPDVQKAITMDVKKPQDLVYLVGRTRGELGGSELMAELMETNGYNPDSNPACYQPKKLYGQPPKVAHKENARSYQALYKASQKGWLCSAHDCSDGGVAVALAESAFAGGWGMKLQLAKWAQSEQLSITQLLFAESPGRLIVTIAPANALYFENSLKDVPHWRLGEVTNTPQFTVLNGKKSCLVASLDTLKQAWQRTLA